MYHSTVFEYKQALRVAKDNFFTCTLPSLLQSNPQKFWSIVNGPKKQEIQLCDEQGDVIPSNQCCVVLQNHFVASFSNDVSCIATKPAVTSFPMMDPILVDWVGIAKLIKALKHTETYSSTQSLQCSQLPHEWKAGRVVPVAKQGNLYSPLNYRPITLTSIPCKLLEHVIYSNLVTFLESNNFFCMHQPSSFFLLTTSLTSAIATVLWIAFFWTFKKHLTPSLTAFFF